jgi:3-phenylpropionate/trans-cinnamate dioxygenase ferredoxin subunit
MPDDAVRHVVAAVRDFPPGTRRRVQVGGRAVVVFNVGGEYFGLLDRCPHQGGPLSKGRLIGLLESSVAGEYRYSRDGEILRCPWHGWEFDLRTGRSCAEPARIRTRTYPVQTEPGAALCGVLAAETIPVRVEEDYVVIAP